VKWVTVVAPLWLCSEFGAVYKYSDLLTYLQLVGCMTGELSLTCSWRVSTYVAKPSAVGQHQADTVFHPSGVDKMRSRLQLDVRNLSLGKRHLVNAYQVKAGIGFVIAGNTVWSMPERLRGFTTRRYINPLYHAIVSLTSSSAIAEARDAPCCYQSLKIIEFVPLSRACVSSLVTMSYLSCTVSEIFCVK